MPHSAAPSFSPSSRHVSPCKALDGPLKLPASDETHATSCLQSPARSSQSALARSGAALLRCRGPSAYRLNVRSYSSDVLSGRRGFQNLDLLSIFTGLCIFDLDDRVCAVGNRRSCRDICHRSRTHGRSNGSASDGASHRKCASTISRIYSVTVLHLLGPVERGMEGVLGAHCNRRMVQGNRHQQRCN